MIVRKRRSLKTKTYTCSIWVDRNSGWAQTAPAGRHCIRHRLTRNGVDMTRAHCLTTQKLYPRILDNTSCMVSRMIHASMIVPYY